MFRKNIMGKSTYKKKIVILVLLIMTIIVGLIYFSIFNKQNFEGTFKDYDYDDTTIQEQEEGNVETLVFEKEELIEESTDDNKQKNDKDSKNDIDVWNLSYYVNFLDDDKTVIQRSIYKYGSMPSCPTPKTKIVDGYEYTFESWSPSIHIVKGTQIYTATYTRRYVGGGSSSGGSTPVNTNATVKYKDADGNIKSIQITAGITITIDAGSGSITGSDSITLTKNQSLDLTSSDYTPTPTAGYGFKGYTYDSATKKFTAEYGLLVTVTFDVQGHGSAPTSQAIAADTKATKPSPDPTADGYVFKGWYKEATCETEWNFVTDTVTENTTIYAKWQVEVNFNMQGHGTAPTTQIIDINGKATKPSLDPTATGYAFGGWYKEAACTNEWDFDNDTVTENTTIYAKWTVTVNFNMQGHGTAVDSQTIIDGSKVSKPTDPSDSDYVFKGWYKEAACTNAWNFTTDQVTKNTTLYAKWQVEVTFNVDGDGSATAPNTLTVNIGSKATKPSDPIDINDNFVFGGWYKEAACTNEWDFDNDKVNKNTTLYIKWKVKVTFDLQGKGDNLSFVLLKGDEAPRLTDPIDPNGNFVFGGWYKEAACTNAWDFDNDKVNKNTTLYAKWQAKVVFDVQGKCAAPTQQIIDVNGKATKPTPDPTCDNYVFEDWYKESTFENKWDFTTDTVTENTTIYAKWQAKVTFDLNGKGTSPAPDPLIVDINTTATKPASNPTDSNYVFEAWYKEAACTNKWNFTSDRVDKNTTLYAKWQVKVTFDVQGKGTAPAEQILDINATATKPSLPIVGGYAVEGWYEEATFENEWDFDTPVPTNKTLYAKWDEPGYTVTFDYRGKGDNLTLGVLHDRTVEKPADPEYDGLIFKGWYKEAACTNEWNFDTDTITGNTTIYAKWQVEVSFDVQGKGTTPATQTLNIGDKATQPAVALVGNWAVEGWYEEASCTTLWNFNTSVSTSKTLYAKWVDGGVTVTFDVQGKGDNLSSGIPSDSRVPKPANPIDPNGKFVFGGWYTDTTYTTPWDFNTTISTDETIYAKWQAAVTFNMQGHGVTLDQQVLDINSKVNEPTSPVCDGYVFDGWYKEAACTNAWDFDNDTVTENTTLYAKWTVTVSFNMQGHGTAIDSQTIIDGSKVSKPTDPTATGYVFDGWYKEAACTNAWDFDNDTVTENTTLYAKWTVTVNFNMQGHGTVIDSQTIIDGSKVSKPTDPTDSDYVFKGWYKEASCTNEWNFDTDTVSTNTTIYAKWQVTVTFDVQGKCAAPAMLTLNINDKVPQPDPLPLVGTEALIGWYREAACTNEWNFASDEVTKNTVLYAKWQTPGVTVTFDLQGKGSNTSFGLLSGSKVPQPIDPTATGYVFDGWYKEAACTNAWDFTTDTASTNPTTLYAKWTVTVTFNMQGHGTAPAPLTKIDINSKVTRPSPDPTATGYVFKGWYKEAACTNAWDFDNDKVTENTTIYAKWITALTDKILNAKTIYIDGEPACLSDSANSVINVNGINCYVLKVDGDKAELITQGIYDVRFNSTNTADESEYKYSTSGLKTWMDDFYTDNLKSGHDSESGDENAILETTVNYYYTNENSTDLTTYTLGEVNQHVFALDAKEAQANKSKFQWASIIKFIDNESMGATGFWTTAGFKFKYNDNPYSSDAFYVDLFSNFGHLSVTIPSRGARPAFWISLD